VHVIVVGCGRVGAGLATRLDAGGHSVAVVDRDREAFRRLPDAFGGATHVGVGFDRDVLQAAGVASADALVAVTNGDNSNVVAARVAREAFDVEHVVARIYDPARARIYERLGIATVATSAWTIDQVLRRIDPADRPTEWVDPSGALALTSVPLPRARAGEAAADLDLGPSARLVGITREGAGRLVTDAVVLQEGDLLHVMVETDHLHELPERLGDRTGGGH